jgi:hypothetical protein
MTPREFILKWRNHALTERAAVQPLLDADGRAQGFGKKPDAVRAKASSIRDTFIERLGYWTPKIIPTAALGEAPRKYPDRFIPKTVEAQVKLKSRTLINLYNQHPQWLADAHATLDKAVAVAVAAAYGWAEDLSTDETLKKLLALNLERAAAGR